MFSGLGSINDLNQQFAQFTSNLTNLDTLQNDSSQEPVTSISTGKSTDKDVKIKTLEAELASLYQKLHDTEFELTNKNENIISIDNRNKDLEREVSEVRGYLSSTTKLYEELKDDYEIKTTALEEALQSVQTNTPTQSPTKNQDSELQKLKTKLTKSIAATKEYKATITDLNNQLSSKDTELSNLQSQLNDYEVKFNDMKNMKMEFEDMKTLKDNEISELKLQLEEQQHQLNTLSNIEIQLTEYKDKNIELINLINTTNLQHNDIINNYEQEQNENLNNIVKLNDEKAIIETKMNEQKTEIIKLKEIITNNNNNNEINNSILLQNTTNNNEIIELKKELTIKSEKMQETEKNITILTEKIKEIMHRYAELKTKTATQLQQADEKYNNLTSILQAKVNCTIITILIYYCLYI